ncbi:MAG TPA: hypothetical protein VE222_09785, partial [Nitrospiraceae bacterium]|nr:hypothetical protein [Nitrospiraceae bacterium]
CTAKRSVLKEFLESRLYLGLVESPFNKLKSLRVAEAVKLDKQEGPQREAERLKKETDDLAVTRLKNQKSFRP